MNYGKEYTKFYKRMEKQQKKYAAVGMTDEQIKNICDFDKEIFLSDLKYMRHNQSLNPCEDMGDDMNPYILRFPKSFTVPACECCGEGRYDWIEEIENERIYSYLKTLDKTDLEILTMNAFEGKTQKEISAITGMSQQAVSYRIRKYREALS